MDTSERTRSGGQRCGFQSDLEAMLVPRILGLGLTKFTFGWTVLFSNIKYTFITAVVNSIDRSTGNRTSNRCLPFDGIGARHPGIVALSGHTPAANGNLVPAPGVIRDAEPQYHQKVNNDLGLYSLCNGLSN